LTGHKLAVLVLPTTSWPRLRAHVAGIVSALASVRSGEYLEITL